MYLNGVTPQVLTVFFAGVSDKLLLSPQCPGPLVAERGILAPRRGPLVH